MVKERFGGSSGSIHHPLRFSWGPVELHTQVSLEKAEPMEYHFTPLQGDKIMMGRDLG